MTETSQKKNEIPQQFKDCFFCLVRRGLKKPIGNEWQLNPHAYTDPKLQTHLQQEGSVGVLTGFEIALKKFLVNIDADSKQMAVVIRERLPATFRTTSGSEKQGEHSFFFTNQPLQTKYLKLSGKHAGEFRGLSSKGTPQQTLIPPSTHPSGSKYSIVEDREIEFITAAELEDALKDIAVSEKRTVEEILLDPNASHDEKNSVVLSIFEYNYKQISAEDIARRILKEAKWIFREGTLNYERTLQEVKKLLATYSSKPNPNRQEQQTRTKGEQQQPRASAPLIDALTLLAMGKRRQATEALVETILSQYRIYTTRDDEKSEMWIYREGIYIPQGKTFIREACRKELREAYTAALGNEVISKIEADTYIDADKFFENKRVEEVAVENGILNVKTSTLRGFTPEEIFFNKLPVRYDQRNDCPTIKKHFETVLKNKEDIPVVEELFGYCLLKDYPIEKATMLSGDGRNGKGKTLDLLKRFLGADNCVSVPLQQLETDQFATGELFNKMANIAGDLDSRALKYTGSLKTLTGRDLISAQRKYLPRVKFVNFAKMIFACNQLPKTLDLSLAFWNRWVLLEFPFKFLSQKEIDALPTEEREGCKLADPQIVEKLSTPEELSGLLNLSIKGLKRLLEKKDFSYCKSTEEVKQLWLRKSDSFAAFLMDWVEEDPESKVSKSDLRKAYVKYCKGHKLKTASDKAIKETLSETFSVSEERDSNQVRVWEGIKLKIGQQKLETGSNKGGK
jgi:P4 family phage/plasmid primase-like protien